MKVLPAVFRLNQPYNLHSHVFVKVWGFKLDVILYGGVFMLTRWFPTSSKIIQDFPCLWSTSSGIALCNKHDRLIASNEKVMDVIYGKGWHRFQFLKEKCICSPPQTFRSWSFELYHEFHFIELWRKSLLFPKQRKLLLLIYRRAFFPFHLWSLISMLLLPGILFLTMNFIKLQASI